MRNHMIERNYRRDKATHLLREAAADKGLKTKPGAENNQFRMQTEKAGMHWKVVVTYDSDQS